MQLQDLIQAGAGPYSGGMRSSVGSMLQLVHAVVPINEWDGLTFVDLTCNTAATACMFSYYGATAIASDLAARGTIAAAALLKTRGLSKAVVDDLRGLSAQPRENPLAAVEHVAGTLPDDVLHYIDSLFHAAQDGALPESYADMARYMAIRLYVLMRRNKEPTVSSAIQIVRQDYEKIELLRRQVYRPGHEVLRGDCSILVNELELDGRRVVASVNPPTNGQTRFDAIHRSIDAIAQRGPYAEFPALNPAPENESTVDFWTRLVRAQVEGLPSGSLMMNLSDSGDISWDHCQTVFGPFGECRNNIVLDHRASTRLTLWEKH